MRMTIHQWWCGIIKPKILIEFGNRKNKYIHLIKAETQGNIIHEINQSRTVNWMTAAYLALSNVCSEIQMCPHQFYSRIIDAWAMQVRTTSKSLNQDQKWGA